MTSTTLIVGLNNEWAHLAYQPAPREWCRGGDVLDDVLASVRDDPDERLAWLLGLQAHGDQLAGRLVLQAMLGKLVLMAADDGGNVDDYVTECWVRIRTYPLARRPRRIAANLAMDTWRGVRSSYRVREMPRDPVHLTCRDEQPATARTVLADASALGLIDAESAACLFAVYGLGLCSKEVAERFRISPALVRWRNARSIRRLAPHAVELAATG